MRLVKMWLPVVLWAALILSTSNDSFSAGETGTFLDRLFGRPMPYVVNILFRKCAHLAGYGILGALAFRASRREVPRSSSGSSGGGSSAAPPSPEELRGTPRNPEERTRLVLTFGVVLLVATLDETTQGTTLTRSGSPWDVLLDLTGAALAVIVFPAVRARLSSRRTGARRAPTAP